MGQRSCNMRHTLILLPLLAVLAGCGRSVPPEEAQAAAQETAPRVAPLTPEAGSSSTQVPGSEAPAPAAIKLSSASEREPEVPASPAPIVAKRATEHQRTPAPDEESQQALRPMPAEARAARPSRSRAETHQPEQQLAAPEITGQATASIASPPAATPPPAPIVTEPADEVDKDPVGREPERAELVIPPPPPLPGPAQAEASNPQNVPPRSAPAPLQAPDTEPAVMIPEGTVIEVRLAERLSSETSHAGDRFQSLLDRDIADDRGQVIVPKGTAVEGTIVSVAEPGRVKGRASLTFRLDAIEVDHSDREIRTNDITIEAESGTADDMKKVGVGAAVGAALGGIFGGKRGAVLGGTTGAGSSTARVLLSKGKQVVIDRERLFSFRLEQDLFLDRR